MANVRYFGGGAVDLGTKNIIENGTYNASSDGLDGYSQVTVNVPEKTLGTKSIITNGTYNASADNLDGYSQVNVNVPSIDRCILYDKYIITGALQSDVYTVKRAGRYLAINIELVSQSSTAHNTIAGINTSGTIISSDSVFTTGGSNNHRDCTMSMSLIDCEAGDTITYTGSTISTRIAHLHLLLPADTINTISCSSFDTITDHARDDTINVSGTNKSIILCGHLSTSNESMSAEISNQVGIELEDILKMPYGDVRIGFTESIWSATMGTTSQGDYTTRLYTVWNIT